MGFEFDNLLPFFCIAAKPNFTYALQLNIISFVTPVSSRAATSVAKIASALEEIEHTEVSSEDELTCHSSFQ